ncbi:MAG TPA: hypothetical protein PKM65_20360 [Spirochaetota bacterium]|nr:hypothetical protein [Spirochaetota bacterium]
MVFNRITELFVKIKDALGNGITSTDLGSGKRGLDVNASVTIEDVDANTRDGAGNPITSTDLGSGKRGLDVNVAITPTEAVKIRDKNAAGNEVSVDAAGNLSAKTILRDATFDSRLAKVDASGNQLVILAAPVPPTGKTAISNTQQGDMSGVQNSFTVIPNGYSVVIQRLKAGAEHESNGGSKVELWYAPNGNTTGMTLLEAIYINGSSNQFDLAYESPIGNGTRAILLRRSRLIGGSVEVFAKWEGYY